MNLIDTECGKAYVIARFDESDQALDESFYNNTVKLPIHLKGDTCKAGDVIHITHMSGESDYDDKTGTVKFIDDIGQI